VKNCFVRSEDDLLGRAGTIVSGLRSGHGHSGGTLKNRSELGRDIRYYKSGHTGQPNNDSSMKV
jgi:hypothetical protein